MFIFLKIYINTKHIRLNHIIKLWSFVGVLIFSCVFSSSLSVGELFKDYFLAVREACRDSDFQLLGFCFTTPFVINFITDFAYIRLGAYMCVVIFYQFLALDPVCGSVSLFALHSVFIQWVSGIIQGPLTKHQNIAVLYLYLVASCFLAK